MIRRWNFGWGAYLTIAVLCSLALTLLTIIPPRIFTDWPLLTAWGVYKPQRVEYPWPSYGVQVALWAGMVGALIATSYQLPVSGFQFPEKDEKQKRRKSYPEIWIVIGITLVGFGLRLHGLRDLPLIVDEIAFAAHASDILHGQSVPIFAPGHNANPSVYSWLVAEAMGLFGQNRFAIRLIPLVFGMLSVPAIYMLGRQWWSRRVGIFAAAFLAAYPAHIFYSRMSLYNIVDPFFAMLALAFLGRAVQHPGRRQYWVAAGIMAGIAQYFYHGSRLVLVLMAAYVLLEAIKRKDKSVTQGRNGAKAQRWSYKDSLWANLESVRSLPAGWRFNILWMIVAFGVVSLPRFAPMLLQGLPVTGNEQMMQLPNDLDINLLRATLAWFGKTDMSPFWMSNAPLIPLLALVLFVIGFAVSLRRWCEGRYAVLVLSVLLTTIFGGAIWTAAPLYVRYMTAVPAIALLVAVGVSNLTAKTQRTQRESNKVRWIAVLQITVMVLICAQGIWAVTAHLREAKGQVLAELWEEDTLAQQAAGLPSGTAAVFMASAGFRAKPPDPRVMEWIAIAHYVAAYGERRPVVLNWDGGKILKQQLKRLRMPYVVMTAYGDKLF